MPSDMMPTLGSAYPTSPVAQTVTVTSPSSRSSVISNWVSTVAMTLDRLSGLCLLLSHRRVLDLQFRHAGGRPPALPLAVGDCGPFGAEGIRRCQPQRGDDGGLARDAPVQ